MFDKNSIKIFRSIALILFLILMFSVFTAAYDADFDARWEATYSDHYGTINLYNGEYEDLILEIDNKNNVCDISCTYDGKSTGEIGPWAGYEPFTYRLTAPISGKAIKQISVEVTCTDDCDGTKKTETLTIRLVHEPKCGDENCEPPYETCISCSSDCRCTSGELCNPNRQGSNSKGCYRIICGDGYTDLGETSSTCCKDAGCPSGKKCVDNTCKIKDGGSCSYKNECAGGYCVHYICSSKSYRIGDGHCDSGEDCSNSPNDCACGSGLHCQMSTGKCVECISNVHCSGNFKCLETSGKCVQCLNDKDCDYIGSFSTGGAVCSADHNKVIQKGTKTYEKCISNICKKETKEEDEPIDCTLKGTFCQEGKCGCDEGYAACQAAGECVRKKALISNEPCKCGFQCKTQYCREGKCTEGLDINFKSTDTVIRPGEETSISLSINNPFNEKVFADIIIQLGSGSSVSGVLGGDECSSGQCKTAVELPEYKSGDITVRLQGKDVGVINLQGKVKYEREGEKLEVPMDLTIKVTECGKEDCSGKLQRFFDYLREKKIEIGKYSISLLVLLCGILALVIILGAAVLMHKTHVKHKPSKEKKKKRKEEKQKPIVNVAKEIKRLADLKEKGILTEKEFKKKKKQLLKKK